MPNPTPPNEQHTRWYIERTRPLLNSLAELVKCGKGAEMTPIERATVFLLEPDIRRLAGDDAVDAFRKEMRRFGGESLAEYCDRLCQKAAALEPAAPAAEVVPGWKDEDELTRDEAAARLGTTKRYFRTQFEAGRVRGKRYSRKTIKYIWGEVREDWGKLAKA